MQSQTASIRISSAYDDDNEQHVRAIDRLVQELGVPAEEVNRSYREILDGLKGNATIKSFLPVLVSRSVKVRLQQR
jgi:uncharacterized protein DUF3562